MKSIGHTPESASKAWGNKSVLEREFHRQDKQHEKAHEACGFGKISYHGHCVIDHHVVGDRIKGG